MNKWDCGTIKDLSLAAWLWTLRMLANSGENAQEILSDSDSNFELINIQDE